MKRITALSTFLVPAILACLLISCGGSGKSNKESLELAIWGDPDERKIVERSLKDFYKKHPGVNVIIRHIPGTQYLEKIQTRAAAGDLPDVFFMEVGFIDIFIDKGYVAPLDEFIAADPAVKPEDYFKTIFDRFRFEGKIYGIPRDVAPFACVYYNKDLFDKAGITYPDDAWSMDEFIKTAKSLTIRDGDAVTQWGFTTWMWRNFFYAGGGNFLDDNMNPTRCLLDSPGSTAGVKLYQDLFHVHKISPVPGSEDMNMQESFKTGRVAMYMSGIWETTQMRDITAFDWDVAMAPKGLDGKRRFDTGGSGYAVSSRTEKKQLAWELLKVISGEYGQIQNARKGLAQPALISLAEGEHWAGDLKQKPLNKKMLNIAVNHIEFSPRWAMWREMEERVVGPAIDLIARKEADIDEKLFEITQEINLEIRAASR